MPNSKSRKTHKHPHIDYIPHEKKRGRSIIPVAMAFCAILAMGIAWFAAGPSITAISIGALAGLGIGYLAGKEMNITFKS